MNQKAVGASFIVFAATLGFVIDTPPPFLCDVVAYVHERRGHGAVTSQARLVLGVGLGRERERERALLGNSVHDGGVGESADTSSASVTVVNREPPRLHLSSQKAPA